MVASTPASANPVLTPPPPSWETCKTVGNGFTCEGTNSSTYGPWDTGFACGSGASAFDIFDQGTANVRDLRFYNTDGNLTRGITEYSAVAQYINPVTGATIPYIQHQNSTNILAVPCDLTSRTSTVTGQNNFTVPGMGLSS